MKKILLTIILLLWFFYIPNAFSYYTEKNCLWEYAIHKKYLEPFSKEYNSYEIEQICVKSNLDYSLIEHYEIQHLLPEASEKSRK